MGVWALVMGLGCVGEVEVWLRDPSAASYEELRIDDFELPFEHLEVRTPDGWVPLTRGPNPYNLLDFDGDDSPLALMRLREEPARLALDEVPPVRVAAVRLVLRDEPLLLEENGVKFDVVLDAPDERLRVPIALEVEVDATARVTLGLDVRAALAPAVGGGFSFRPELVRLD